MGRAGILRGLCGMVRGVLTAAAVASCARSSAATADSGAGGDDAALLRDLHVQRRVLPQLSIATAYRRCPQGAGSGADIPRARCATPDATSPVSPAVMDVAARAAAAVQHGATPAALQAAALVDLLWSAGSGRALDRSIASLRTTARISDRPASALVDLAAAYLVRAGRTQEVHDLLEAIEAADRAVETEPRNPAARFDLALAMEELELAHESARAWSAYLALDSTSGWAAEARGHLRTLLAQEHPPAPDTTCDLKAPLARLATTAPSTARRLGWDHCLGEWGAAVLRGDTAVARRRLAAAAVLGDQLEQDGHDATLAEEVRAIRRIEGNPETVRALARAHRAYAAGRARYRALQHGAAANLLERASTAGAPSPRVLRQWSRIYIAGAMLYAGRPRAAERVVRRVVASADSVREPALAGRARWTLGTIVLRHGDFEVALHQYRAARHLFARAGERDNVGATEALIADATFRLGDWASGFGMVRQALGSLRPYHGSVWTHAALAVAADAAAADVFPRSAVRIADDNVLVARPRYVAEARLQRARLLASRDPARARHDLAVARRLISGLSGATRTWLTADAQVTAGSPTLYRDPVKVISSVDSAVAVFAGLHNSIRLLQALVARADARLSAGEVRAGEVDLDHVVQMLDDERDRIGSATLRASLLDAAHGVFDHRVMLSVDADRPAEGLIALERGRASLGRSRTRPVLTDGDRLAIPPGAVGMEYALIGDTLLAWTVIGSSAELSRVTVDQEEFVRTIGRTRAALESHAGEATLLPPGESRSGAFTGLAQAFLGAGAGGVVGAEWPVDDHDASILVTRFHNAYRASGHPAEALRQAQLRLIHSSDPALRSPGAWAAFRYAGG